MLVFKKITVYKPVSSYIGKSNGICLKFLQGGNIERGGINIVVQHFFFFLVTHCPQDLKMVLSSFFFLFLAEMDHISVYLGKGICQRRMCKQKSKTDSEKNNNRRVENILQTKSIFLYLYRVNENRFSEVNILWL